MNKTYTNPRTEAEISDWPMGGGRRGVARFAIESKNGRQRVRRQTSLDGQTFAPKLTTYARRYVILDDPQGRIALVSLTASDQVRIEPGTLKTIRYVHRSQEPELCTHLMSFLTEEVAQP